MNFYDIFISCVFLVKALLILLAVTHLYIKKTSDPDLERLAMIEYWEKRLDFIFIACMAIILIYVFFPYRQALLTATCGLDHETMVLLFLFGIILLVTAKWDLFFEQSKWFATFKRIIGVKL